MASAARLDDETERLIADLVAGGEFADRSDVIREGIRLVWSQHADIGPDERSAVEQGLADADAGRVRPAAEVFRDLRNEFGDRA